MFQSLSIARAGASFGAPPSEEAIQLVSRYPNLSEVETARLINLYRELPALQVALMISDEKLAPKVDRFVQDHRSKISVPFRQYAVLVAIAIVGLAVIIWAVSGS
jgi:hypothetical protein